ncbi:PREDICTED: RNA/RNP complex-1-interacting phosphatase-like [Thamnophis sirtalis]|uniref:RNA/RNP complex-1-interacting phosphatase n=1 Tax=Thamnophis sirtalis TaxID=35019 RepID=A0A6I9Z6D9_9SAUR|nr:PREDICTED: RNA/RNP complex-1-interacting phosphatase-like [Thamnophis sirtalis]
MAFRLGARSGRLGLPFRDPEWLPRPEEQAADGGPHARYSGPSAGGAAQGGSGGVVDVPRVPPLRPGGWQGRAGSSGPAHGRKPEAAEAGSPGQSRQGGGAGRGAGGSGPRVAMGKKNGLPDRWTDYRPLGKRISGTRFIAFKVPLKKSFEWRLAPDEYFSPLDLITQVEEQNEELGLIIDLTYTTHYYEPMELPDTLQYCKILTMGHKVPNHAIVSKFKSTVKKFLRENQHNDKLIGVHCTHGLNRTGYLVCRYLIDVEGMDPNMAIELFNRCRGHSIERKNYISALQKTSGRRNHHYMDVSQRDWMKGHVDYTPSPDYEVAYYGPQNWEHPPRNFPFRRGGRSQKRKHSQIWSQNLITCYSKGSQAYSPQYPPSANIVHQGSDHNVRPSNRPFFSQEQFQGYQGPSFQELNPHGSLLQQHRNQIDNQHYWIP